MTDFRGISDTLQSGDEAPVKCDRCGTTTRIGSSCLTCLLQEGVADTGEASSETFERVLAEASVPDTQWRLGNYQILGEIGRGGMGVIYRARQRHSRRIVALKRVLSYHADSRETLERFRREAEAAASLDHPHILPIYEVGEAEGLPFFTMKYATGGSLQRAAAALRSDLRECVRLTAKVARAVAHAHAKGILHRDLKPGNILLDGNGEPMVSDFGLAKWMETECDLTRSLAIFGTPGFIAPEQADGPRGALTAAADIYSLGAILFELVAGRPPFLGEHALAVIRQAAELPAPKLRSVLQGADRDLETICAKCLEREPRLRYSSAGDLADDLERWLDGRSIAARPVSVVVQAWRGAKRNPRLAGSIAACVILAGIGIAGWRASSHYEAVVERAEVARRSVSLGPIEDLDELSDRSDLAAALLTTLESRLADAHDIALRPSPAPAGQHRGFLNAEEWKAFGAAAQTRLIVTGSVRERHGRYRIAVHVIESSSGAVVSTSLHDLESIPQIGPEIVRLVAQRLESADNAVQTAPRTGATLNAEARSYYERAREFFFRYNLSDLDRAIVSLRQAIELDAEYGHAYALLASACQLRSKLEPDVNWLEQAEHAASAALRIAPDLADTHRALGGIHKRRGRLKEALDANLTALELEPRSARTAAMLGNIYEVLGQPDVAVSWLERAMSWEARPIYADNLADALTSLGELEEAEKAFRTAAIFRPDLPVRHLGLIRIALIRGDFAAARAECQQARAEHPGNPQPLITAGLIEFFARNYPAAEQLYREASAFGRTGGLDVPSAVGVISALGFITSGTDPAAGRALLHEAIALDLENLAEAPENPHQLYSLAANRAALHEGDAALATLDRAIAAGWSDHHSLALDPRFDSIRNTPRFETQVRSLRENLEARAQRRRARQNSVR